MIRTAYIKTQDGHGALLLENMSAPHAWRMVARTETWQDARTMANKIDRMPGIVERHTAMKTMWNAGSANIPA